MSPRATVLAPLHVGDRRSFVRCIEGVNLHWVEYGHAGAGGGVPVVLLHGLTDSHLTWSQIAPELGRTRRVLALDLPGHGLSDRPDVGYELAWYARIVDRWMESLGLDQVDIVGHSLGGGIALMLLRVCRARVRRLVLAAPGGLGREISFALRLATLPGIVEWFGQPFMALGTWLVLRRWRARLPAGQVAASSAMNARIGTARALARTARDLVGWRGQRHSFVQQAHEIETLPSIGVLWGDRDAVVPVAHGRALARQLEGVRFAELAGCGHSLHLDDPRAFRRAVTELLDAAFWSPVRLRATPAMGGTHPLPREAPLRAVA